MPNLNNLVRNKCSTHRSLSIELACFFYAVPELSNLMLIAEEIFIRTTYPYVVLSKVVEEIRNESEAKQISLA